MYKILTSTDYMLYIEHVKDNMKNCRHQDDHILSKISNLIENNDRVIIFAELDENFKIVRSILTIKRMVNYEYLIVSIRSATNYFSIKKFLNIFDFMFEFYEKEKYYKWMLTRKLDFLKVGIFKNLNSMYPFSKYETAIEAHSEMIDFDKKQYESLFFSGIPLGLDKSEFVIISGFCKQRFRLFPDNITQCFV